MSPNLNMAYMVLGIFERLLEIFIFFGEFQRCKEIIFIILIEMLYIREKEKKNAF